MTHPKLTTCACGAHKPPMTGAGRTKGLVKMLGAAVLLFPLGGCITVETPDEPIVIELNINITQEVIYRLAEDAENTIDENADIF